MEELFTDSNSEMKIVLKKPVYSHMCEIVIKCLKEEEKVIMNLFSHLARLL